MSHWFGKVFLVVFLTALEKSESVADDNVDGLQSIEGSAGWDLTECEQLQDRLETLELAVRSIVSAMASQKNEIFAPITAILEQNAALRVILSSPPVFQGVPENSTIHPDFSYNTTTNTKSETDQAEKLIAVNQLKGAVKCSLAQLLDIKVSEKEPNPSGNINASLNRNKSIEIEWTPLSPECIAYNSGVWIRVFESETPSSGETYLSIPRKCLAEKYNSTFSFAIHSPTKSDDPSNKKSDCHFELTNVLIECRSYKIELIPNYESLKGRSLTTEIVTPSTNGNSIDMKSLLRVATSSSSLTLDWKDNSGCAPQLTSFYLKTIPDGVVNATDETHGSLKIPRTCLDQKRDEKNLFSLTLSADHACPVKWTSLDACRKYAFEMKSEYSKTWSSAPHLWETFTFQQGSSPRDSIYGFSNCPNSGTFYCARPDYDYYQRSYGRYYQSSCQDINEICNGKKDCDSGLDEKNCDKNCITGFKCGRQCISKEKVCDGSYDCVDGSDEHYDCEYAKSCSELINTSGIFSSSTIHSDNVFKNAVQKTIVAISAQSNQIIWLSFSKFNTKENHLVKVYDGPYSTSPLLLSKSGSTKPSSVRSSSNNLYVEFPSYYDKSYGVSVSYTSMENMEKPFVPGCGGYVYGDGSVSSPNYLSNNNNDLDECFWFVEARQSDGVIFVKRNIPQTGGCYISTLRSTLHLSEFPIMTVYDGWNSSGQVLYDELDSPKAAQAKSVVYSVSQKMMIRFTRPKVSCSSMNWSVTTIPKISTTTNLVGMIGTIKSPNYPAAYPNSSDFRWKIVTEPGTSIRLLFALFETQEKFDYIFVFDGPTINSPLLLEKSGLSSTPFAVNSSSNEMLIRFTSDENITLPGFLALYSTVQIL
ncbi:uncharacterized protein LOC124205536 [Daphnia pulex]|uniref:uncharacterized protein LOC124205536 n=1 Tax=Daphnia pulex TaxID=6669 RepID=UPI001EDE0AD2|nr:uncharacterized protein LOC124205536 [Daphnia pulex]